MDSTLYIRIRGRVLGPYEQQKLQSLARRGQLSRMHELSTDGITWVRASNYPELFTGGQSDLPALPSEGVGIGPDHTAAGASHGVDSEYRLAGPAPSTSPVQTGGQSKWYYTSSGEQRGPVEFSDLQMLVGLGQLSPQDSVWSEGMAVWTPASQVHGLIKSTAQADGFKSSSASSESKASISATLARSAQDSRGWAMFISSTMYLWCISNAAFGILVLIVGARERSASSVAYGIICLVHALVIAVGASLLTTYASRLGQLKYSQEAIILEHALDALRNFWIFVSMYLVVAVTLIVIGAIAVFAYGVTIPHLAL